MTITGTLAQVNADLSSLADKDSATKDKIIVNASDSQGGIAQPASIAVEAGHDDDDDDDDGNKGGYSSQPYDHGQYIANTALLGNYMASFAPAASAGSSTILTTGSEMGLTPATVASPGSWHG